MPDESASPEPPPTAPRSSTDRSVGADANRAMSLAYVSRGLGVGHVPLRIACPAELTLVPLTPA